MTWEIPGYKAHLWNPQPIEVQSIMKYKDIHKIKHEYIVDGSEGEGDHPKLQGYQVGGLTPIALDINSSIY